MTGTIDNGFRAMLRALRETVKPSLDTTDPLPREQLDHVIDYLEFMRDRVVLAPQRETYELSSYISMGAALPEWTLIGRSDLSMALSEAITDGQAVERAPSSSEDVRRATAAITAVIRQIIRESPTFTKEQSDEIFYIVLSLSGDVITMDRAWWSPLGLDPDSSNRTTLEELLS
jgi:hypothetical protein